jgi:hypothetical protein
VLAERGNRTDGTNRGADLPGVSPVPAQMWQGLAQHPKCPEHSTQLKRPAHGPIPTATEPEVGYNPGFGGGCGTAELTEAGRVAVGQSRCPPALRLLRSAAPCSRCCRELHVRLSLE